MSEMLETLFEQASAMPASEREAWLRDRSGGDESLVAEVIRLLAASAQSDSFLETPPLDAIAGAIEGLAGEIAAGEQRRIGPYQIERLIGSGGMGEVYLARRVTGEFEQRVAVKLVRSLATKELVARFGRERRVLASLAHPNIASLIDGGETERGTPYLVMSYVEGEPIDAYCAARSLRAEDIVRLVLPVLDAVTHAHRRLIVHRDLKPANILVDADGRPVVPDFGIAKVLGEDPVGPEVTGTRGQLLTPMYASPEQVRNEPISTATDVFSLGVMLYELLSGTHPWAESDRPDPLELARRICEMQPRALGATGTGTRSDGRQSQRAMWTDLDAVISTAIRKEPERRYPSVERFADDLRRVLEGRAVTARPDTLSYRTSRFTRRNRIAVVGVAAAVLAMVGGTGASLWQAQRAQAASALYLEQLNVAQTRSAQLQTLAASLVTDVYDSIAALDGANPARLALLGSAIDALDELERQLGEDPRLAIDLIGAYTRLADAQALRTIGSVGDTAGALESSAKALAIADRLQTMRDAPRDAPILLSIAQRTRGDLLKSTGRFAEARAAYTAGLAAVDEAIARFPDTPRVHQYAIGIGLQRGALERRMALPAAAQASYEAAIRSIRIVLDDRPDDHDTRRNLGIAQRRLGDLLLAEAHVADAESMFTEAAAIFAGLLEADPGNRQYEADLAVQHQRLGDCALRMSRYGEAKRQYDLSHEMFKSAFDQNPGDVLAAENASIAMEKLADVSAATGDHDAAANWSAQAARLTTGLAEQDPDNRAHRLNSLFIRGKAARMAADAGRDAEAELVDVAESARLASLEQPNDAYPAEIEIEARCALARLRVAHGEHLVAALDHHRPRFSGEAWFVRAEAFAAPPRN